MSTRWFELWFELQREFSDEYDDLYVVIHPTINFTENRKRFICGVQETFDEAYVHGYFAYGETPREAFLNFYLIIEKYPKWYMNAYDERCRLEWL